MRANPLPLILLCAASVLEAAEPERIDISSEWVVGLSGIEVSADGTAFVAVSDRGWFVEGILQRDESVLVGGEVVAVKPILGMRGRPTASRRAGDWSDAEGIATAPEGGYFVSFERWMRVAHYESTDAPARFIKDHSSFRSFDDNRQLEAVAIDASGRPIAIPETPLDGTYPVYRLSDDAWEIIATLPVSDGYSIVGADTSHDGKLYILERKLMFATWFRSRLSVVEADWTIRRVWESNPGEYGNLEGVSIWEAADGRRAVMISDNNARQAVPTEIVELRLTD